VPALLDSEARPPPVESLPIAELWESGTPSQAAHLASMRLASADNLALRSGQSSLPRPRRVDWYRSSLIDRPPRRSIRSLKHWRIPALGSHVKSCDSLRVCESAKCALLIDVGAVIQQPCDSFRPIALRSPDQRRAPIRSGVQARAQRGEAFQHKQAVALVGHLFNLSKTGIYRKRRVVYQVTRPTVVRIGERRQPDVQGRPGYLRWIRGNARLNRQSSSLRKRQNANIPQEIDLFRHTA